MQKSLWHLRHKCCRMWSEEDALALSTWHVIYKYFFSSSFLDFSYWLLISATLFVSKLFIAFWSITRLLQLVTFYLQGAVLITIMLLRCIKSPSPTNSLEASREMQSMIREIPLSVARGCNQKLSMMPFSQEYSWIFIRNNMH